MSEFIINMIAEIADFFLDLWVDGGINRKKDNVNERRAFVGAIERGAFHFH